MKSLTVTQSDKSVFKFVVGHIYALKDSLVMTYLKLDKPMRVEWIGSDSIQLRDPISGSGTFERICMLDCMKFEKVV